MLLGQKRGEVQQALDDGPRVDKGLRDKEEPMSAAEANGEVSRFMQKFMQDFQHPFFDAFPKSPRPSLVIGPFEGCFARFFANGLYNNKTNTIHLSEFKKHVFDHELRHWFQHQKMKKIFVPLPLLYQFLEIDAAYYSLKRNWKNPEALVEEACGMIFNSCVLLLFANFANIMFKIFGGF